MNEKLSQHIHNAASKTFESLAFLEVFPAESPIDTQQSDSMAVHLRVTAPYLGLLGLQTSKSFLMAVGQRLFACPTADISDRQISDLLNELLNTIAGSFLTAVVPSDQPFAIGLPLPGLAEGESDSLNMCVWDFKSDEGMFTLYGAGEFIEKL